MSQKGMNLWKLKTLIDNFKIVTPVIEAFSMRKQKQIKV